MESALQNRETLALLDDLVRSLRQAPGRNEAIERVIRAIEDEQAQLLAGQMNARPSLVADRD